MSELRDANGTLVTNDNCKLPKLEKTERKLSLLAIAVFQFPQPNCCKQQLLSLADSRSLPGGRNWPDPRTRRQWIIRCSVFPHYPTPYSFYPRWPCDTRLNSFVLAN